MNRLVVFGLLCATLMTSGSGCSRKPAEEAKETAPGAPAAEFDQSLQPIDLKQTSAGRVVALGDTHGDLEATRRVLRLAGAIDEGGRWIGEDLVVVQTGDQVDRGADDPDVIDFFEDLAIEAEQAGGKVFCMLGNHEIWNVGGYFGSVSREGFDDFAAIDSSALSADLKRNYPPFVWGRLAAFTPGGPYARKLADRTVVQVVDDSIFVHGGVDMDHVNYGLERVNADARAWLLGVSEGQPESLYRYRTDDNTLTWDRRYSDGSPTEEDCAEVTQVLEAVGVQRMVMGHTVQDDGITSVCDGKVWRIDVGLAEVYDGPAQALEIRGAEVRVLKEEAE